MYPLRITPTEAQRSTITKKDKVSRPCGFLSPPEARPATVPSPEWISKNCDPFRYGQPWRRSPNAISQASISSILPHSPPVDLLLRRFRRPSPPPPSPQGGARAEEELGKRTPLPLPTLQPAASPLDPPPCVSPGEFSPFSPPLAKNFRQRKGDTATLSFSPLSQEASLEGSLPASPSMPNSKRRAPLALAGAGVRRGAARTVI